MARRVAPLFASFAVHGFGALFIGTIVLVGGVEPPSLHSLPPILLVGCTASLAAWTMFFAFSKGEIARVAPTLALAAVVPITVGVIGGERPASIQVLGMMAALVGLALLAGKGPRHDDAPEVKSGPSLVSPGRSVLYGMAAAFCIGALMTGVNFSAAHADPLWAIFIIRATSASLTGFLLTRLPLNVTWSFKSIAPLAVVGMVDSSAISAFAFATREGLLSIVAVLGSCFPAITTVLGILVLRERLGWLATLGAAGILVGVALIVLGNA